MNKEFDKETKELGDKWRDFEAKKTEHKQKMQAEKEENWRRIKEEYQRLEEECNIFEEKKKLWNEEKKRIEKETNSLLGDYNRISVTREQAAQELRKEQEQKTVILQSYETQMDSLMNQVFFWNNLDLSLFKIENAKREIMEYEMKKEELRREYNEIVRVNEEEIEKSNVRNT